MEYWYAASKDLMFDPTSFLPLVIITYLANSLQYKRGTSQPMSVLTCCDDTSHGRGYAGRQNVTWDDDVMPATVYTVISTKSRPKKFISLVQGVKRQLMTV